LGVVLLIIGLCFFIAGILSHFKDKKSKRKKSVDSLSNNQTLSKDASKKNSRMNKKGGKKIVDKVKNANKSKNPNEVLKKHPSKTENSGKELEFTPKYERPRIVTRKPIKKSDLVDVTNVPDVSNIQGTDKSQEIYEALSTNDFIETEHSSGGKKIPEIKVHAKQKSNVNPPVSTSNQDDIAITSENKVSLDDLKNSVLTSDGEAGSKQAFELLVESAQNEILLETSSIKELDKSFSSKISSLNVRIIVQEFDNKDESIMLLVNSFKEQGANIKVLPSVNTTNLIVDGKNALIVSKNEIESGLELGAIYDETKEILEIRKSFDNSWEIAADIDT
jgi:hypothetical protein